MFHKRLRTKVIAVVSAAAMLLGTVPAYAETFDSDGDTSIPVTIKAEVAGTYEVQLPAALTASLVKEKVEGSNPAEYNYILTNPTNGGGVLGQGKVVMTGFPENHGVQIRLAGQNKFNEGGPSGTQVVDSAGSAYDGGKLYTYSRLNANNLYLIKEPTNSSGYNDAVTSYETQGILPRSNNVGGGKETLGKYVAPLKTGETEVYEKAFDIGNYFLAYNDGDDPVYYRGTEINQNTAYGMNAVVIWKKVVFPSEVFE